MEGKTFIEDLERAIIEAVEHEEYSSAANLKRIKEMAESPSNERYFCESEISQLQSRIHKHVGDGEVMGEFNKFLGISAQ